MSLEDLGNIGELVGAIAVVVSLVYLAVQIRQNTRSVRAASYQQVVELASEFSAMLCQNSELLDLWIEGTWAGLDSLSDKDRQRYGFAALTFLRRIENIHFQQLQGTLDPPSWAGIRESVRDFGASRGIQQWWPKARHRFTPEFVTFVKREICAGSAGGNDVA